MSSVSTTNSGEARRVIALASLGGALDFYDFVIFGVFTPYLSHRFFPAGDELVSLIKTFGVFAAGYLVRPLGGLVLSHFGDRAGRKRALQVSMLMMSLATLLMGALPSYETWGATATFLFIALRLVQGFSLGGEIPGAITFATEALPEKRGLVCGLIFFCINMGLLAGLAVHEILIWFFSRGEIEAWAWRLPFFLGGIFGFFSYFLRRQLHESQAFAGSIKDRPQVPALALLREHFRPLLGGCLITALGATLIALCFIYMPVYLTEILHREPRSTVGDVNLSLFVFSFLIAFAGWASDYGNRLLIYAIGAVGLGALAYPLFHGFAHAESPTLPMMLLVAVIGAFITGTFPPLLSEIFPTEVRFSGIALAYNIPYALFGGMAPLVATTLIRYRADAASPFIYLAFSAILGLAGAFVLLVRSRTGVPIRTARDTHP